MFKSPGPYGSGDSTYDVAGVANEEQELLKLEQGWHDTKEQAWAAVNLDHDGDGMAGGSLKPAGESVPGLRAEYQALAGKKAFPGWGEDLLREKIAALTKDA